MSYATNVENSTGKVFLCSHLFIGSKQNTNTKNSFVFALSLPQTISENSAFWPKQKKKCFFVNFYLHRQFRSISKKKCILELSLHRPKCTIVLDLCHDDKMVARGGGDDTKGAAASLCAVYA